MNTIAAEVISAASWIVGGDVMSEGGKPASRNIPAHIQRQLRQEAGFGCVVCGEPFIDYHHIVEWSVVKEHDAANMMILCPTHHRVYGSGAYSAEEQLALKADAINIRTGHVKGFLHTPTRELVVRFGGFLAIDTPELFAVDEQTIVSARLSEDNRLLISAVIEDSEGQTIGRLVDNEWDLLVGDTWDFSAKEREAAVRRALGDISLKVDMRGEHVRLEGSWYRNRMRIEFGPKQTKVGEAVTIGDSVVRRGRGPMVMYQAKRKSAWGITPPPGEMFHLSLYGSNQDLLDRWEAEGRSIETIEGIWLWDELAQRNLLPDDVEYNAGMGARALQQYRWKKSREIWKRPGPSN